MTEAPRHIRITKGVVKLVVGISTGFTVKRVLASNVETDKRRHEAEAYVGGVVIGAMVADQAEEFTDRKIDEYYDNWLQFKKMVKQTGKTAEASKS